MTTPILPVKETYYSIDMLGTNQLIRARIHNLASPPSNPGLGQIYYNTTTQKLYYWAVDHWASDIVFKGDYASGTDYGVNDVVVYSGNTYIMTVDAPAGTVPTNTTYWQMLAQGGVIDYTNAAPTTATLGGIAAGQTFSHTAIKDMFDMLLYPYQAPGFSSFSMSGQATTVEVGTTISGSKTFTWGTSNSGNVTAGSVSILDGASTIASGLNASGSTSATITSRQLTAPGAYSWNIQGTNTHSATFSSTFTVNWRWKVYSGTSASTTLTENAIEALTTSSLAASGLGTYTFAAGLYKYIAYPSTFGNPASIKDVSTNLTVTMADATDDASYSNVVSGVGNYALVSVTNAQGTTINYKVFRTKYQLSGAIQIALA